MNTSKIRALGLFTLIATLSPLAALAQSPVQFAIPFGFNVGSKSLAAGEYVVGEVSPGTLSISSADGHAQALVMTFGASPGRVAGKTTLTFQRYGDRYFLSRMSDYDRGWEVPKSAVEKELISQHNQARRLDILASTRR